MTAMENAIKKLVELNSQFMEEYFGRLEMFGADKAVLENAEKDFPEDWFNTVSEALGKTPKEFFSEAAGGEITAEAAIALYDAFARDSYWPVPEGVCALLKDAGDKGVDHIVEILSDRECLSSSYYNGDLEAAAKQDVIVSALKTVKYFACEKVRTALWQIFAECPEDNEAIIEFAADGILEAFGAEEAVAFLGKAESIGFKELTIMQGLVNSGEKSDDIYRCLRKCVKISGGDEKIVSLSMFADYGDPRAVTMLRSVAKEMKEQLGPAGENQEAFQRLYMIASMIKKLGGNTEDIIGM